MYIMDENLISLSLQALTNAIVMAYQKDSVVIRKKMERTAVARIFYYMQSIIDNDTLFESLKKYNLDLEYHKKLSYNKTSPRIPRGMYPDLLLHIREQNTDNLLCAEFKMQGANLNKLPQYGNKPKDWIKLEDLTKPGFYGYKIGVFVILKNKQPEYTFFRNGEQYLEQNILGAKHS